MADSGASAEIIAGIERAGEEYARFVEGLSPEAFHRRPGPEDWSAAEITGHVSEAPVTFAGYARRVVEAPGASVGRMPDDPGRLAAVARLGDAGPVEGARLVREGIADAVAILRALPPEGWQAIGTHPRLGDVTVADMVRASILEHVRGHLEQARAAAGGA
jgi:hypothetical protein